MRKTTTTILAAALLVAGAVPAMARPTSSYQISATHTGSYGGSVAVTFDEGSVSGVVTTRICADGGVETWTSTSVTTSTVSLDRHLDNVSVSADFVADHTGCDGSPTSGVSTSAAINGGMAVGKTARSRDAATGDRILETQLLVTVIVPDLNPQGVGGLLTETISK